MKEWEAEFRRQNWRDMHSYLKRFPYVTPEENKALRSWVRSGHSPYENGDFIATETGNPMDFINALRFLEDEYLECLKNPEDYRASPENLDFVQPLSTESDGVDLPF